MPKTPIRHKIVFLSTYPPRECGIATFTRDLTKSIDSIYSPKLSTAIIAMNISSQDSLPYPKEVVLEIAETDPNAFIKAAEYVNNDDSIIMVNVQHEFGIFGGIDKDIVLHFYRHLSKPVITTFHTVLPDPNPFIKGQIEEIFKLSTKIIVLNLRSKEIFIANYNVDENKISVIAHGIHPVVFVKPEVSKKKLGLSGHDVISTFGLLSPDKGVEYILEALPKLVKQFPTLLYLIIGETHPKLVEREGEKYRNNLKAKIKKLGVEKNIMFYNKYLTNQEILKLLQASDIYISGSLNPNQAVSGTLSYAAGTGRAVISTKFLHAQDLISPDMGILVDFKKPDEYVVAVSKLLSDKKSLEEMHLTAYFKTRFMLWNNISIAYVREFSTIARQIKQEDKKLPAVNLKHINKLMDSFALRQFSDLHRPQNKSGYTVDDNARAMIAFTWLFEIHPDIRYLYQVDQILTFLEKTQSGQGLLNYFYKNGKPTPQNLLEDLQDANGRAVWSLGVVASSNLPESLKKRALLLMKELLDEPVFNNSLRGMAFAIKGISLLSDEHLRSYVKLVKVYANKLVDAYLQNSDKDWLWFESNITYANTVMCEALILAFQVTKNNKYLKVGKKTLDFYIDITHRNDIFMPVGEAGWYPKHGDKAVFDQQPEAASDLCLTASSTYHFTGEQRYRDIALKTFYFFLGDNILGEELYDRTSGACYDGLTKDGVNLNQGAESTLSYLLSRLIVANPHLAAPMGIRSRHTLGFNGSGLL